MTETVITYLLSNPDVAVPMDRRDFYEEQIAAFKAGGAPTRAVEIVNIFIFNAYGELIVQKRSYEKNHNPGLLDKSIGGHVRNGDTPEYTVMTETIQELQTPSIVLKNQDDFAKTMNLLSDYLETVAIVRYENTEIRRFVKIIGDEKITLANKLHLYYGIYHGRTRPADREAKGILFYSLPDLRREMEQMPEAFSDDLRVLIKEHGESLDRFATAIGQSRKTEEKG